MHATLFPHTPAHTHTLQPTHVRIELSGQVVHKCAHASQLSGAFPALFFCLCLSLYIHMCVCVRECVCLFVFGFKIATYDSSRASPWMPCAPNRAEQPSPLPSLLCTPFRCAPHTHARTHARAAHHRGQVHCPLAATPLNGPALLASSGSPQGLDYLKVPP